MANVIVIGGGASGMIAALKASNNNKVTILEKNDKCGKKLLLTGNGHCNYWNEKINLTNYQTNDELILKEILTENNIKETFNFLEELGIYPRIKNGYYYPYSNQATSVLEILKKELIKKNIEVIYNVEVKNIKYTNKFEIETNDKVYYSDKVILATGSKAYPKTGSDGRGYEILKKLNHNITSIIPSLVPIISNEKKLKNLENIRVDANASLYIDDTYKLSELGEVQITKNGLSGICIFNLSGYIGKYLLENKKAIVSLNFLPNIDNVKEFLENRSSILKNKTIEEMLESLFHYKLLFSILEEAKIDKNCYYDRLSEKEKNSLLNAITDFRLNIVGTESFDRGQVCLGGLSLKNINCNMESNIIPNLYIVGELLDVTGKCGGFNLAFAFISAYIGGSSC